MGMYCTFIGVEAGADVTEGDGLVIIGDGLRDLPAGARIVIGQTVFGQPCNLADILNEHLRVHPCATIQIVE